MCTCKSLWNCIAIAANILSKNLKSSRLHVCVRMWQRARIPHIYIAFRIQRAFVCTKPAAFAIENIENSFSRPMHFPLEFHFPCGRRCLFNPLHVDATIHSKNQSQAHEPALFANFALHRDILVLPSAGSQTKKFKKPFKSDQHLFKRKNAS